MPIYTYGPCPRGHPPFDKHVPMSEMNEMQPCPGRVAEPRSHGSRIPKIVPCQAPSERREVPSTPATFIIR